MSDPLEKTQEEGRKTSEVKVQAHVCMSAKFFFLITTFKEANEVLRVGLVQYGSHSKYLCGTFENFSLKIRKYCFSSPA